MSLLKALADEPNDESLKINLSAVRKMIRVTERDIAEAKAA